MILVHVEVERNIKTVAEDRHNRKKGVIVVELDQFRYKISGFEKPMEQIKKSLDLENKKKRIEELEADMEAPGFWDNTEKSQHAMKELKTLKSSFEKYNELEQGLEDAKTLIEMADEENDASLIPEVENEINSFEEKLEDLRIETLLSGEYDKDNAILTFKIIKSLCCISVSLCPSCIHSEKHLTPVAGLCSACSCMQCKDSIIFVILT